MRKEKDMFLHIGNQKTIRTRDIIGIFDMDNATVARQTRHFLASAEASGKMKQEKMVDIPKSFIIYKTGQEKWQICFSQLSSTALAGRIKNEMSF